MSISSQSGHGTDQLTNQYCRPEYSQSPNASLLVLFISLLLLQYYYHLIQSVAPLSLNCAT